MAELRVTSGGVAAETGALLEQSLRLQHAGSVFAEAGRGLGLTAWRLRGAGGASAVAADRVEAARARCTAAAEESRRLGEALRTAAGNYGSTEQQSSAAVEALAALLAGRLGRVAPYLLALGAGPGTLGLLLAGVGARIVAPWVLLAGAAVLADPGRRRAVIEGLAALGPRLLSDTATVTTIRLAVQSSDDLLLGWAQLPEPVRLLLAEQGLDLVDPRSTAGAVVLGAGILGLLRETPVRLSPPRREPAVRAVTVEERIGRIPPASEGEQIRVERFRGPDGERRFELYIGPTLSASLRTGEEAFDPASIMHGLAGFDPGALRAVEQSLAQAGARPGDAVVATGYSQGGEIAALLAERGDYDVQGLLTVGAPVANIDVPAATTWVALQHDDDALAGAGGDFGETRAVLVERTALSEDFPFGEELFPAHDLGRYGETAALADGHDDERLRAALAGFDAFGAGTSEREAFTFRARRVDDGGAALSARARG